LDAYSKYTAYSKFAKKSSIYNTTKTYNEILGLPLFPNITKKHQDSVIKVLKSV
jgi:Predicted pyridoxal phosphate-dependent enzyme apparently involved in regulation of cell wall biogenesis